MKKILVLCCGFLSFGSQAELNVVENYKRYSVHPTSKSQLLQAANQASTIRSNGEVFHGYTQWNISWNFRWQNAGNRCRMVKVNTKLVIEYTMPKLFSKDSEVKGVWNKWYPNLLKHEKRHGELAKQAAAKINTQLANIKSRANCTLLSSDANKLGNSILDELRKNNERYDKQTNHGQTEGTWLAEFINS